MDYLAENNINHIDYKDVETLKHFIDQQGRIKSRRHTNLSAKRQREVKQAIKRARYMALLPYIAS